MIVTVTPNLALDVTYDVDRVVLHTSHRVRTVHAMAGGKGVNVASVLTGLGKPVVAAGLAGGTTGSLVRDDLSARGIRHVLVEARHETRRTVTVVSLDDGEATAFNEPGAAVAPREWAELLAAVGALVDEGGAGGGVLVGSGSVPGGFPDDGYAQLVRVAAADGWHTVVDSSGPALLGALEAGPDLVKPNARELAEVTGATDPITGARALQDKGARDVLVSLGPDGMVLVTRGGEVLRAALGASLPGNPTGAGDAAVAAAAAALAAGASAGEMLTDAVAWSAAAVLQPVAGMVDESDVARLRGEVRVWRD